MQPRMLSLILFLLGWCSSTSFPHTLQLKRLTGSQKAASKADLSGADLWNLKVQLKAFNGTMMQEALAKIRFMATKNYEPPQGRIFVEDDYNGIFRVDEDGYGGRWTLSEDKKERKDGLWICKDIKSACSDIQFID